MPVLEGMRAVMGVLPGNVKANETANVNAPQANGKVIGPEKGAWRLSC